MQKKKKRIFWLKSEQTKITYSLAYVCGRNRFVFCAETCWDEKHYRWLIKHKSSSSPPSSWGPLSSVQASNRNQLQNSFWGIGGTRSSAAALWRWWRCGRSTGRPHPCDEWTGSQCGLRKERAFIKSWLVVHEQSSVWYQSFSVLLQRMQNLLVLWLKFCLLL